MDYLQLGWKFWTEWRARLERIRKLVARALANELDECQMARVEQRGVVPLLAAARRRLFQDVAEHQAGQIGDAFAAGVLTLNRIDGQQVAQLVEP